MNYAVFFKAHSWDDLIYRNYLRLKISSKNADIYILFDNTNGMDPCVAEEIISINQRDISSIGLIDYGGFWYNGDYASIIAFLKKPNYDYYVFCEYDVFVNCNIEYIINKMHANSVDCLGKKINDENWPHHSNCAPYYNGIDIEKSLFCISFFSRAMIVAIYFRRIMQSFLKEKNNIQSWPIGEAVMATEPKLSGLKYDELENYGVFLENYDWTGVFLESHAEKISKYGSIIHPISNKEKFIKMNFRHPSKMDMALFEKIVESRDSDLYRIGYHMENTSDDFKKMLYESYKDNIENSVFEYISDSIVSFGAEAKQSSISDYSYDENESKRALNHFPRGTYSIHTNKENNPWWLLDLGEIIHVKDIYFFDRPYVDTNRSLNLTISCGKDLNNMREVFFNENEQVIYLEKISVLENIRYVKVHIKGEGILNFDSVIVTA